jgi:hypothetical protein
MALSLDRSRRSKSPSPTSPALRFVGEKMGRDYDSIFRTSTRLLSSQRSRAFQRVRFIGS